MEKTKLIFVGLIILLLASCSGNAKFEITNNSEFTIDSLCIKPAADSEQEYISLKKGETKKYTTNMSKIPSSDGHYTISYVFIEINENKIDSFGYFTSGRSIEKLTKIEIDNDSLYFEFEF